MFALFQLFGYSNKVNGQVFDNLPENRSVLQIVKSIVEAGVAPEALQPDVTWQYQSSLHGSAAKDD